MALITLKEYAENHNLSRTRIFQFIQEDRLKTAVMLGKRWYVDADDEIIKADKSKKEKSNIDEPNIQIEEKDVLENFVSLERYAELHGITVSGVRRRIKDNRMRSAVKIGGKWFLDKNEPIIDGRLSKDSKSTNVPAYEPKKYDQILENYVTVEEYAKSHGLAPNSIRQKITSGQINSAVKFGGVYFIDKNEPLIDKRVKSGKYVTQIAKIDRTADNYTLSKFGINDLAGVIISLLSDTDFLKTKRTPREDYFIKKWSINKKEMEILEDALYDALHPDKADKKQGVE